MSANGPQVVALPRRRRKARGKRIQEVVEVVGPVLSTPSTSGKAARRRRQRARRRQALAFGGELRGGMAKPRAEGLGALVASHFGPEELPGCSSTLPGSFWLNKVLDPCHPCMSTLGVPDSDTSNVVTPQYMSTALLDNSVGGLTKAAAGFADWDTSATWNFVHIIDWSTMQECIVKYQGDLTGAVSSQSIYVTTNNTGDPLPESTTPFANTQAGDYIRLTYAGITYEPSMPTLADQGRSVGAQIKPRYDDVAKVESVATDVGTNIVNNINMWTCNSQPGVTTDPNTLRTFLAGLTVLDDSALVCPAKLGAYFPVRWTEPTHAYREILHSNVDSPPSLRTTDSSYFLMPFTQATFGTTPVRVAPTFTSGPWRSSALDSPMPWSATVYWVTGLHHESNYQLVYRYGIELQLTPQGSTPFLAFAHPSPSHDPLALECADRIRVALASAYTADYNFLDKLWGKIKGFVSNILPIAKPILGAIPGVGQFAGPITDLLGTIFPKSKTPMKILPVDNSSELLIQLLKGLGR